MDSSIKFTAKWSYRSVSFLDINIISDAEGRLTMDLYTKPTDTHQYLHWDGYHWQYCRSTISYSQVLRIYRICSGNEEYLTRVSKIKSHLVNQDYDETRVQCQIDKATNITWSTTLKKKEKEPIRRVPKVVTYHPDLPQLHKIPQNHLPTLLVLEKMQLAILSSPLVANHQPRNLKDLLVRLALRPQEQQELVSHNHVEGPVARPVHIWNQTIGFAAQQLRSHSTLVLGSTIGFD